MGSTSGFLYASLGGQPIVPAASAIEALDDHDLDDSEFSGKANSYTSGIGEESGHGSVLMTRARLDELSTSEPLILKFGIGTEGNEIELNGIYIHGARTAGPSASHADEALYVVDLVDTRYHLMRLKCNKQYNCRRTGGTTDNYNTTTLDDTYPPARAWTWIRVIEDLWGLLNAEFPTLIGTFSAHPNVDLLEDFNYPDEILPENLRYDGVSAWAALNDVCRRVGCAIVFDNAFVHNFYLVRLGRIGGGAYPEEAPQFHSQGGSKVTIPSATAEYYSAGNTIRPAEGGDGLLEDKEVLQGNTIVPENIVVMFPTSFDDQASGELESEYGRWYPKSISGPFMPSTDYCEMGARVPVPNFNSNSQHIVYETKHARFSSASDATPNNSADLDLRARKIAEDVYRTLVDCAGAHVSYAGIHYDDDSNPTIPGKTVSEVTWGDFGNGLRTDIYRSPPDLMPTKRPIRVIDAGGGVGGKIWFKVISISDYYWEVPGCEYIRAEVTQKSCSANVAIGDIVYIFDPFFCWFNLPIAIMMRITGTATFAENGFWDGVTPLVCGVTPGKCFWCVDNVCCLEEEYGTF
jgi:hypothetical protein